MKKTKLFYVLMASALVLGACAKRNDNTPAAGSTVTVGISPRDTAVLYGDSIYFTIVATSSATLSTATFAQSINGAAATQVGSAVALTNSSDRVKIKYNLPTGALGKIKLTCTVTDNTGNTDTASAFITVLSDINSYTGVLLASYNSTAPYGSFFSSSNGQVYTKTSAFANQKLIDMIFYSNSPTQYFLAAPGDVTTFGPGAGQAGQVSSDSVQYWTSTTRNNTTFYNITSITTLSGITYGSQIKDAFNGGNPFTPGTLANNLSQGQIIGFQTEAGRSGLIQIENPNGGDASGDGALTINVVVQK